MRAVPPPGVANQSVVVESQNLRQNCRVRLITEHRYVTPVVQSAIFGRSLSASRVSTTSLCGSNV